MVSAAPGARHESGDARTRRGFTLLEVLAAVALLAIWFIVIAGTAIQGLRAEGISRRRLAAAMIADRRIAELEASTVDGVMPELMEDVSEDGDYTITVRVTNFAPPGGAAPTPAPAAPAGQDAAPPDLQTLLANEMPARTADLRTFDVRVSWDEGGLPLEVARTAFAFDLETAKQAYEKAGIAVPESAPSDEGTPSTAAEVEDE